jgi:serine/threonine protein kinase
MLAPGARLGALEVVGPLGAGGMGEVYRARDTRLGREVAVKVLPEAVAEDTDRLARFEREARLLAALNHPGIGAIHGTFVNGQRTDATVPLVDGDTLRLGTVTMTFRMIQPEAPTSTRRPQA